MSDPAEQGEQVDVEELAKKVVADPQLGGWSDGWGSDTALTLANGYLALRGRVRLLEQREKEPPFRWFVRIAQAFSALYPPDVFDGSSGDPGPVFVVAIRDALAALAVPSTQRSVAVSDPVAQGEQND